MRVVSRWNRWKQCHSHKTRCVRNEECVDTIRYDTRCDFNVRSKADISQLNLPHGTDNYKSVKTEKKLKSKKTDMLRSNSKQFGKGEKGKTAVGRICKNGRI